MYCSVPHIHPPSRISPPSNIFSQSFCTGIFISRIGPPTMYGQCQNSYTARSPWWSGNARTKPAYTEQPRNSLSIASVFVTAGVSATAHWKNKPGECLENATVYTVSQHWSQGIRVLEDERREGRLVLNQLLSVCQRLL